eukprot:m.482812 g.482812  ORF g.482812 m.482812 type:complete len:51 (-) comp57193_c0_seq1:2613-2765(-)
MRSISFTCILSSVANLNLDDQGLFCSDFSLCHLLINLLMSMLAQQPGFEL